MKNKKYIYLGGGIDPINFGVLIAILKGYKNEEEIIIESSEFKVLRSLNPIRSLRYEQIAQPVVFPLVRFAIEVLHL